MSDDRSPWRDADTSRPGGRITDSDLLAPELLRSAFEASCLIRCTDVGRSTAPRPGERLAHRDQLNRPPVLAEFSHEGAALRLIELLSLAGHRPAYRSHGGGVRRRFTVHQVVLGEAERATATRTLATGWWQGRRELLGAAPVGASSPQNSRRADLGQRAWRAALLAGGPRQRNDLLGVRLGNQEMAALLVRAARLLSVTATIMPRSGCLLVTVSALEDRARITQLASLGTLPRWRTPALAG